MSAKWYMNNPCKIIRVINNEFVEIEVYPKFLDDISGWNWCVACMGVAGDGAHPTHTCAQYQDVIDYINSSDSAMIVVAETRLLQDHPVEFKPMIEMREKTKELINKSGELQNDIYDQKKLIDKLRSESKDLVMQQSIETNNLLNAKYDLMLLEMKVDRKKSKLHEIKHEIKELERYLELKKKFE